MLRRAWVLPLICLSFPFATTALATPREPLPPPGAPLPAAPPAADSLGGAVPAGLEGLLTLASNRVEVFYLPDALDRGSRVQDRLENLHELFTKITVTPLPWKAAAIDRVRWNKLAPGWPWGLPVRIAGPIFLVPAHGDAGTVATATWLLGGAPPDPGGDPMTGTRAETGSLVVCDALLQIEVARAFVAATGIAGDEPWVTGVLVQLAARYAWEALEPGRMLEVVGLFDRMAAAHPLAAPGRLTDYRGGLPFDVDLWYQAQFVRGADAIWVAEGRRGVARHLGHWISAGKPVRRADLEKKYPALVAWERAAFAP